MKITWFGRSTLRIYLGGFIVVVDPERASSGTDLSELLAGANRVVRMGEGERIDPAAWRPKPAPRAIESAPPLEVASLGTRALLISAAGEPPLVVLDDGEPPRFGRWADGAVIVLTSARESLVAEATVLLDVARPRLIALALDEQALDLVVQELGEHLQGAGLVSLEPGLALEV